MSEFDTRIGTVAAGPSPGQVRNSRAARTTDKAAEEPRTSTGVENKASVTDASSTSTSGVTQQIVSKDSGLSATLERVAQVLDDFVPGGDGDDEVSTSLKISQDSDSGRFVYKSVDDETGEVVRQFPPEEILNFISRFRDAAGLLVDGEV